MFFELAPQDLLSRSPGIFAFGSFKKVSRYVLHLLSQCTQRTYVDDSTVLPSYFRAETQRLPGDSTFVSVSRSSRKLILGSETALVRSINEPCYLNTTSQLSKNFTMTDDHITTSSIDATLGNTVTLYATQQVLTICTTRRSILGCGDYVYAYGNRYHPNLHVLSVFWG